MKSNLPPMFGSYQTAYACWIQTIHCCELSHPSEGAVLNDTNDESKAASWEHDHYPAL